MKIPTLKGIVASGGLILTLCSFQAHAQQYVTIPDPGFRYALKLSFPTCFNAKDELDITCANVKNATHFNCSGFRIQSIEGIQYLENLRSLDASYNFISTLPSPLPSTLRILVLQDNQLTSLPNLPNLELLNISSNFICDLPPSSIAMYLYTNDNFCVDFTYQVDCGSNEVKFYTKTPLKPDDSYTWDFGDPNSSKNTSTESNPTHLYTGSTSDFNVNLTLKNEVERPLDVDPNVNKYITISKQVSLSPPPKLAMEPNVNLCAASTILNPGPGFKSYLWQDGSTSQTLEVKKSGTYTVMVTNDKGCSASQQVVVNTCTTTGGNQGNNGSTGNGTNQTNGSSSNDSSNTATTTGGDNGKSLEEFNKLLSALKLPNVFTPNGDGRNEYFEIKNLSNFPQNKLEIYSRWGDLIYQVNNYQNNWSASNLDPAVYFYQLTLYNSNTLGKTLTGWVGVLSERQ